MYQVQYSSVVVSRIGDKTCDNVIIVSNLNLYGLDVSRLLLLMPWTIDTAIDHCPYSTFPELSFIGIVRATECGDCQVVFRIVRAMECGDCPDNSFRRLYELGSFGQLISEAV